MSSHERPVTGATIHWSKIGPNTAEFTVKASFLRSAYGVQSGYCPTCTDGALPKVGDIIYEGLGGSRLVFGDGTDSPILSFEIVELDEANDRCVGVALDPAQWNRAHLGKKVHSIQHTFTRKGPFSVGLSTGFNPHRVLKGHGLYRIASTQVDLPFEPERRERNCPDLLVWRTWNSEREESSVVAQKISDGRVAGREPSSLNVDSRYPQDLWAWGNKIVYSAVDPADGVRCIYAVSRNTVLGGKVEEHKVSPEDFIDNRGPHIRGDWVLATGWNVAARKRDVWARNLSMRGEARILSLTSWQNEVFTAVSANNALWSGWDEKGQDSHVYWQDLLDSGGPSIVSDERTTHSRAEGDVYECLRCYIGWNQERNTWDIFFRTLPFVKDNPPTLLSCDSMDNIAPEILWTQVIFEGFDQRDGRRHVYYIPDVTAFREGIDRPVRLSDVDCPVWPWYDRPNNVGGTSLDRDWAAWVSIDPQDVTKHIYVRSLSDLESPRKVSTTSVENVQPIVRGGFASWRGMDPETGQFNIYFVDVEQEGAVPQEVNVGIAGDNDWPFLI